MCNDDAEENSLRVPDGRSLVKRNTEVVASRKRKTIVKKMSNCSENKGRGLFITDIDGTLLNDAKRISSQDLDALSGMQRAGIAVALATGRSNNSLVKLVEKLVRCKPAVCLPVDYIIFSTGAGVMDYASGRIPRSVSLANREVQYISNVLEQLGLDYMIHKPVPDTAQFLYAMHHPDNLDFLRRLESSKEFATPLTPCTLAGFGRATEVLCIVPEESGHAIASQISRLLQQFSVIKATSPLDSRSLWIEIFPPTVSKSQTSQWLAKELGVTRERVCAVGNDYNDQDLLQWAGTSFVVANSPPALRSQFQTVASNNDGGVAEAAAAWLVRQ
jgi:Cof subfamily protein (haloacid dehalogenase superfamily)